MQEIKAPFRGVSALAIQGRGFRITFALAREPETRFANKFRIAVSLNRFNGDFVGAEMVKAFLSSSEYRRRFGQ
jgi:hypothetical protein